MEPTTALESNIFTTYPHLATTILILVVIDLVLKGFALWRAARNKHRAWFIAVLVINSVGVLPLIYLLMVRKEKRETNTIEADSQSDF